MDQRPSFVTPRVAQPCPAGVTLTALSSMPARCPPRGDLAIRRSIERVVFKVRTEIANVCQQKAGECDEPPLDDEAMTNAEVADQIDRAD